MTDDIFQLQRDFDDAELRDDAELASLLAEDFLSIGEQGFMVGKQEWIEGHCDCRYLAIDTIEADVRRYDRTAIVRCSSTAGAT
jgi:hypothetical protein